MSLLRKIFGPSKDEIWSQIAKDIGGEYIDGGFWQKDTLLYEHNEWKILLDTYTQSSGKSSTTYTRLRVPFINKDNLRFTIYREGFFSSIGKFFGMQDIITGDPYFDDHFIIKGNNVSRIKQLLDSEELKKLMDNQPHMHIEVRDDEGWFGPSFPQGVDELYFECFGVIKEKDVLLNLFELFSVVLDRLVRIDSAYEDDPKIRLT
ncbi:MAG: DUF3137 domain-containing protein [Flavobacteriales bacterium]|nr:MAG: DUF3137 domain-containing protein [Flavobacteriales bacterium]